MTMSIDPEFVTRLRALGKGDRVQYSLALETVPDELLPGILEALGGTGDIDVPPTPLAQAQQLDPLYVPRPHLRYLSEKLTWAADRLADGRSTRLAVSMPPRSGKSTLISTYLPVWLLRRNPSRKIGLISHDPTLATNWGRQVRNLIENHPELGLAIAPDAGAASEWQTTGRGGVTSRSVGQSVVGRGFNILIIDDPTRDFAAAHSEAHRRALWEWYTANAYTRLEPPFIVLVTATRWHESDLIGRLLSADYEGDPSEWNVINFPAIAEEADVLGRSPGDPLLSPLIPTETPAQALERWADTKRAVGTYNWACTPAETPITMADWTVKPISEVRVGDMVMGYQRGTTDARMRLVPTRVEHVMSKLGDVNRLTMESGATVRCTSDHKWFTGRNPDVPDIDSRRGGRVERYRPEYAPVKVGGRLRRFYPAWPERTSERQRDLDYISGMIDGEGHIARRGGNDTIYQSPDANPDVFAEIGRVLNRLGWSYRLEVADRGNSKWGRSGAYVLRDSRAILTELVDNGRLAKATQVPERLWRGGGHRPGRDRDRVVAIEPDGHEPVYALTTGTGNYIAWGYASSNSQFQGRPAPAEGAVFNMGWWRYWTTNPSLATDDGLTRLVDFDTMIGGTWLSSWDAAFKGTDQSDYVVGQRWVRHGANRYLVGQTRNRMSFTQTLAEMRRFHDPRVHVHLIEDKANGPAIIDTLRDEIAGLKPVNPTNSKEARARAITPEVESGNVYLPHPVQFPWVADLLSELRSFPTGAHDDQVDALTQALYELRDAGAGGVTNLARREMPMPVGRASAARTMRRR